jgi:hypothetical protein
VSTNTDSVTAHLVAPGLMAAVFDLLIEARNSKDEEALQQAIDLVATAACRTDDF